MNFRVSDMIARVPTKRMKGNVDETIPRVREEGLAINHTHTQGVLVGFVLSWPLFPVVVLPAHKLSLPPIPYYMDTDFLIWLNKEKPNFLYVSSGFDCLKGLRGPST